MPPTAARTSASTSRSRWGTERGLTAWASSGSSDAGDHRLVFGGLPDLADPRWRRPRPTASAASSRTAPSSIHSSGSHCSGSASRSRQLASLTARHAADADPRSSLKRWAPRRATPPHRSVPACGCALASRRLAPRPSVDAPRSPLAPRPPAGPSPRPVRSSRGARPVGSPRPVPAPGRSPRRARPAGLRVPLPASVGRPDRVEPDEPRRALESSLQRCELSPRSGRPSRDARSDRPGAPRRPGRASC